MRVKILNLGLAATHSRITWLNGFADPVSVSDYDAFVFDPETFAAQVRALSQLMGPAAFLAQPGGHGHEVNEAVKRRQLEVKELLEIKGGLVLCLLRPNDLLFSAQGASGSLSFGKYAFVTELNTTLASAVQRIRAGVGFGIDVVASAEGAARAYLQVLKGNLSFSAHFQPWSRATEEAAILATDSVANPIAVEFRVGAGRVCFVPVASNVPGDRLGAAVVRTVDSFFAGGADLQEPDWVATVGVPRVSDHDEEISTLQREHAQLTTRIQSLEYQRQSLLDYKRLLFGYGKSVLEPTVRSSLRLVGFTVPEPEEYSGDWDALLTHPDGRTAISEIEGSEGVIDVWKYRQLLDYVEAEAQEGRDHKGILVGNGFRLSPLDSPERNSQFSEHVLRGAQRNSFCLVPTTELFKAVCAVLEDQANPDLKKQICDSLVAVVGPWAFAR